MMSGCPALAQPKRGVSEAAPQLDLKVRKNVVQNVLTAVVTDYESISMLTRALCRTYGTSAVLASFT